MASPRVSIQTEDFDLSFEIEALRAQDARIGAVCSFIGTVRDRNVAPTLGTGVSALPPEGTRPALGRPGGGAVAPTLGTGPGPGGSPERMSSLPPEGVGPALGRPGGGAVAPTRDVLSLELEHYPGMTEKSIETMIDAALQRFDIFGARVVHRVGLLQPLDQIVLVAVSSAHRGQSFLACEFLMDYLKTQAPFWKKEQTAEGAHWVDARVDDDAALARWGLTAGNAPDRPA